jgi:hypothetical protein
MLRERGDVTLGPYASLMCRLACFVRGSQTGTVIRAMAEAKLQEIEPELWQMAYAMASPELSDKEKRFWVFEQIGYDPDAE